MFQKPSLQHAGMTLSLPLVWAVLAVLLAVRLAAIGMSPLGPGVDEAQYWLWGQTPQLGYYSKPPLIAWILSLTDSLFSSQIIGLRITAPLTHFFVALILWQTGALLFSPATGRLAAVLWASLPSVGLGSFVMSTDTPMLLFWSAGLFCFVKAMGSRRAEYGWMVCSGICIGLSALAKYAGLYFIAGVLLWVLSDGTRPGRRRAGLFFAFVVMVFAASLPTWLWNISNGFITILHLGENANLQDSQMSLAGVGTFWSAQFGVFGPVALVLLVFSLTTVFRGGDSGRLHLFVWPVLAIMTVQAFLKEANANWAVAAYPAATLLVSQLATSSRRAFINRLGGAAVLVNLVICGGFVAASAVGSLGPLSPASDPFRHLKGWSVLADQTAAAAQAAGARTIIAYDRESAALLHWHLHDTELAIVLPRLGPGAGNHYHRRYPLTPSAERPLLALTEHQTPPSHLPVEADWQGPVAASEVRISERDSRLVWVWRAD